MKKDKKPELALEVKINLVLDFYNRIAILHVEFAAFLAKGNFAHAGPVTLLLYKRA